MTAAEIRHEIMTMDYTDPNQVANALEHIADKLVDMEHELKLLSDRVLRPKTDDYAKV